jgi:hypothetical protein
MESKLTKVELEDALFNKMHGNSAPGLDGFTVKWLRTFWQDLADITKNALNECLDNNGLTGLLNPIQARGGGGGGGKHPQTTKKAKTLLYA